MRLGIQLARYDAPADPAGLPAMLADLGAACEDSGVDVLSLVDHWFGLPYLGPVDAPMLEGYTTLGFLAAHTRRVQLQLLVTGVTYRHVGLLAQVVATLDVLAGGRAGLGIGAGWYAREHRGLGVPFPPLRDRFVLLDDALLALRQLWSPDNGRYDGPVLHLAETLCSPQPLHPVPVMLDGTGERTALRLVARHADACNIFAGGELGADFVSGKLSALREHCEAEGTAYDAIRRTVLWTAPFRVSDPGDVRDVLRAAAELAAVGVQELHVSVPAGDPVAFVRAVGDRLAPALARL